MLIEKFTENTWADAKKCDILIKEERSVQKGKGEVFARTQDELRKD